MTNDTTLENKDILEGVQSPEIVQKKAEQPESMELTKSSEFKPTPAMRIWIDTALQLMTDNITEIEVASKITAQSWYNWLKNDQFRLWFKQEWDKRLSGESWKLDAIGFKNAKRDHKYWHDMQNRVGNLVEKAPTNNIQLNNLIKIE